MARGRGVSGLVEMFQMGGAPLLAMALLSLLSVMGAVICGGMMVMRRDVPPALPVLPLALIVLLGALVSLWGQSTSLQAVAHASPEMKTSLLAAGISTSLAGMSALSFLATVPALLLAVLAAAAGLRAEERQLVPTVAVAAAMFVAAAAGLLGGVMVDAALRGAGRGAVYLLLGVLAAAAVSARGERFGAAAGALLPVVVAASEIGAMCLDHRQMFEAVAHASAETKAPLLAAGLELVQPQLGASWAAFVAASLAAVIAGGASGGGGRGALLALLTILTGALALGCVPEAGMLLLNAAVR